jgi:hypothetical protein
MAVDEWSEAELYGTRFRFRLRGQTGFDDPSLRHLIKGDVLPSVSRRVDLRETVDVWSSGNRVFRCLAPRILQTVVESLAAGKLPTDVLAESLRQPLGPKYGHLIQNTATQIERLAAAECRERQMIEKGRRVHVN